MLMFLARRSVTMLVTLLAISVLIFIIINLPEGNFPPTDHSGRLDLLDDFGSIRCPGHKEYQLALGAGYCSLGEQQPGRLFFPMCIGDVESHAAGAGGSHLDVDAGAGFRECALQQTNVQNELRHARRDQVLLHVRLELRR